MLADELNRLRFASAVYEASYLHAYNYLHRFTSKAIPSHFTDEIYHSLSFVWRFLPKESLLLYFSRSTSDIRQLPVLKCESLSFELSVDPS